MITLPAQDQGNSPDRSINKQVRGSALLLTGRGCSLVLNLLAQIVIIRSLSKSEYGLLSYVICIVDLLSITAVLCMDKTFSRFGAIYHEQNDRPRLAGTLLLSLLAPVVLGGAMILGIWAAASLFPDLIPLDKTTWPLLIVLAVLIPGNGIASVALSLLTVVRGARAVFFRKHLFGPLLKLGLVSVVLLSGGSLTALAGALLLSGLIVLLIDLWLTFSLAREEQLLTSIKTGEVIVPFRELFGFSLPLLVSDFAYQARGALLIVMLGWLATAEDAASFRAAMSLVRINELVLMNFMVMFVPLASRLYSSNKTFEFWQMQEKTNLWVLVLTFPLFAVSVSLAQPGVVTVYGSAYADVAPLIVLLAAGYFCKAAFGFNGLVLRVLGRMRTLLAIELIVALATIGSAVVLVKHYGALGACLAASVGVAVQCLLKCLAVRRSPGYQNIGDDFSLRMAIVSAAALLAIISWNYQLGWFDGIALATVTSFAVVLISRKKLEIDENFPELKKLRFLSWLCVSSSTNEASVENEAEPKPLRIGYMMSRFPKLTETFVLREMIEMERRGVTVEVYPLQREKARTIHPEAEPFVARANFTPWLNMGIVGSCLRMFAKQPLTVCSTFLLLLRKNWGSRRYLTGAVLFFPKSMHLAERMQRDGIQHLHAHFASHPAMVAWVIGRLSGIPYSFTAHGSDLHRDQHMLSEKVAAAGTVVTISQYNRRMILDLCGQEFAERVHVVHCGIDPYTFPPRDPAAERTGGPLQLACIGTLHEVKGQTYLLQACAALRDRGIDVRCHLIGDGPDRSMLEQVAQDLKLTENVLFHGRRTSAEIQQVLTEADVIVAPSVPTSDGRREGIPVALMEGMASGLVAVASDLSGIPELVIHEETGLLIEPRNSEQLAAALARLAEDSQLRTQLAARGLAMIEEQFDLARNTGNLLELIQQALLTNSHSETGRLTDDASPTRPDKVEEQVCLS